MRIIHVFLKNNLTKKNFSHVRYEKVDYYSPCIQKHRWKYLLCMGCRKTRLKNKWWNLDYGIHKSLRLQKYLFPWRKKNVSNFEFWKKKIRKMPYLSFSPNIIGSPTATATPQMINMDPKIALWFPEVWAWEYSIGCLIARYLKFFVQNWDSMTVAKLLEPIFEKKIWKIWFYLSILIATRLKIEAVEQITSMVM